MDVSAMRRHFATASIALFSLCIASAASTAAEVSLGSPVIYVDGMGAPSSIACYFSNIGDRKVTVNGLAIFHRDGDKAELTLNSCGGGSGFSLAPGKNCFIGTNVTRAGGYGCKAVVDARDTKLLRGAIELRDGSPKVLDSATLTVVKTDKGPEDFQAVASPPLFGAPNQQSAICQFTNLGVDTARLKNYEIRTSQDEIVPTSVSSCQGAGEVKIKPGRSCSVATSGTAPIKDLRCKAAVTRAADIRATLLIVDADDVVLNRGTIR